MVKKLNQITNIKWKEIVACYVMAFFVFSAIAIGANWQAAQEDSGVRIGVQLAATALLLVSLALYCYFADRKTMEALRNTVAMFVTMLVNYVMIYLLAFWDTYGVYLAPFALTSLIMSLIVSGKSGFFANFVLVMLYFMQSINWQMNATVGTENYFYIMFGGVVQMVFASYILGKDYRHLRYVVVGLCLGIIAALCAGISFIMFNDQWNWAVLGIKAACAFASGMIGVMLMFVLVPLFEKLFKVTSVFRFSEIATSDNELMRKLFEKAPGTYNHGDRAKRRDSKGGGVLSRRGQNEKPLLLFGKPAGRSKSSRLHDAGGERQHDKAAHRQRACHRQGIRPAQRGAGGDNGAPRHNAVEVLLSQSQKVHRRRFALRRLLL